MLYERLRQRLSALDVCVDIAARIRVYRRGPDGKAAPAELLPRVYGGRYNLQLRGYTDEEPKSVVEISSHPGALEFLTSDGPEIRTLALGAPGGGKSFAAERKAVLIALDRPNSSIGVVAPTADRKGILWNDLLELLEPLGWIEQVKASDDEIMLINRTRLQFVAAQQPSRRLGTPLQGYSWDAVVEDEHQNLTTRACEEVNFRGRRAGNAFRVFSTATNQYLPEFQQRLDEWYRRSEKAKVVTFSGQDNVFVDLAHWENQKQFLSAEDYDRLVLGKASTMDGAIYRAYDGEHNVRAVPDVAADVTREVTAKVLGDAYEYIIGFDPGALWNSAHVLKAFRDPTERDGLLWWVVDEIVTKETSTTQHGLTMLGEGYLTTPAEGRRGNCVVLIDPSSYRVADTDNDSSDVVQLRNLGFPVYKAAPGPIPIKHRFSMVNALLRDAYGKSRLFIAADAHGKAKAKQAVRSFRTYRYEDVGVKGPHDVSHFTDDIGYALYRFERIRGNDPTFAGRVPQTATKKREFWEVT